jgi:hypothetical protein
MQQLCDMTFNLLKNAWTNLDVFELRVVLDKCIGAPGQYDGLPNNANKLYLPLAGSSCRISLTFRDKNIIAIERGPAFDAAEWERACEEVEKSILAGLPKVGREYSFSSFRVLGSWRGQPFGSADPSTAG